MTRPLLVLGRGGHGRVVADVALACGYDRIAFLDDSPVSPADPSPFPLLGPMASIPEMAESWPAAIAAVGSNSVRLDLFRRLLAAGFETPTIVHPSAVVSGNAVLGSGVFVAPGAVINVGARIGDATIVNTGARIDHDCSIGIASHVAPGATLSGGVVAGCRAWLGTGCSIKQGVTIGDDAIVGVGAAVVSDLAGGRTYVGVPARPVVTSTR